MGEWLPWMAWTIAIENGMDSAMGQHARNIITSPKIVGVFYYTRSIPKDVRGLADRPNPIQKSLKTKKCGYRHVLPRCSRR